MLLHERDELISSVHREMLKFRRDTIEQVRTVQKKLGVSRREKVSVSHIYNDAAIDGTRQYLVT